MMEGSDKWWAFVHKDKLQLIKQLSCKKIGGSIQDAVSWKVIAYVESFVFIMLGVLILGLILNIVPNVLEDLPTLLLFWGFATLHFLQGSFAMLALFKDYGTFLKIIAASVIVSNVVVMAVASNYKTECAKATDFYGAYCDNINSIATFIVLPNFIHSLIYASILIAYMFKAAPVPTVTYGIKDGKEVYKFAHITVIIEQIN